MSEVTRAEMEAVLEAILFVATEPVPRPRLLEVFEEEDRAAAGEALDTVLGRYAGGEARGVVAEVVAGGVRLVTNPSHHDWLKRFFQVDDRNKLSMAALETLAIVAYRQPITAPEIQDLRGVQSGGVLKTLVERRLLRVAGRKQVVGKPFLYATTREFLMQFGLVSLEDLPALEQLEELLEAGGAPEGEDREEEILRLNAVLDEREQRVERGGSSRQRWRVVRCRRAAEPGTTRSRKRWRGRGCPSSACRRSWPERGSPRAAMPRS